MQLIMSKDYKEDKQLQQEFITEITNNLCSIRLSNISNLDELENLNIKSEPLILGRLKAEYDNRGEPYVQGVTLTVECTEVFLDKRDISDFIKAIKEYR